MLLFFEMYSLDLRLLDGPPGAAKADVATEKRPKLVHEGIHELVAAVMGNENRPSLGTADAFNKGAAHVRMARRLHRPKEGRTGGDANVRKDVTSAVHVGGRDAAFNVDHDVVKGKAQLEGEKARVDLCGVFAKAQTSPACLHPLGDYVLPIGKGREATKEL